MIVPTKHVLFPDEENNSTTVFVLKELHSTTHIITIMSSRVLLQTRILFNFFTLWISEHPKLSFSLVKRLNEEIHLVRDV